MCCVCIIKLWEGVQIASKPIRKRIKKERNNTLQRACKQTTRHSLHFKFYFYYFCEIITFDGSNAFCKIINYFCEGVAGMKTKEDGD